MKSPEFDLSTHNYMNNENKLALPKIIFLDIHWISRSNEIIVQLIPELTKLGYSHFLEEAGENISEEQYLKEIGENIAYVEGIKKEISESGLNFEKATDILKHIDNLFSTIEKACDEKFISDPRYSTIKPQLKEKSNADKRCLTEQIFDQKFRYDSHRFLKDILYAIKEYKISFKGVDLDFECDDDMKKISTYSDESVRESQEKLTAIRPRRDSHIASKYLENRTGGVFGRIGLAHFEGVYKKMLENKNPPLVFFIFSPLKLEDPSYYQLLGLESVDCLLQKTLKNPCIHCVNGELSDKIVINHILKITEYEILKMNFTNL